MALGALWAVSPIGFFSLNPTSVRPWRHSDFLEGFVVDDRMFLDVLSPSFCYQIFPHRKSTGYLLFFSVSFSQNLLSSATFDVLTTQLACHSSLVSYLSSLEEPLPSVPGAYGQTLKALPSQPAVSGNKSHILGVVSE
ncbi:hypothetical protein Tco_0791951 [Tanacetum coccineum]